MKKYYFWLAISSLLFSLNVNTAHALPSVSNAMASNELNLRTHPTLDRYEGRIKAFERADDRQMPPPDSILFTGSSSIRLWETLADDFAPLPTINRGFGGSTLPEVTYYAERIIYKYQPKLVVLYCGENDFSGGHSAEDVFQNLQNFIAETDQHLADVPIIFMSIKPSPKRWRLWLKHLQFNELAKQFAATRPNLYYLDVSETLLNENGEPDPTLFSADELHLNAQGYQKWTAVVRPLVEQLYNCVDSNLDYDHWTTQANAYANCQMTLKIIKRNTGQGRVTANDGSIDCDVDCHSQKVAYDGVAQAPLITLTAIPAADSTFIEWRAGCQGKQPTTQVTVERNKLCVAEFGAKSGNVLNIVTAGEGSGRVRSTTPINTIYCTQFCLQDSATFDSGAVVRLIATAESGAYFDTWLGDCSGTEPTITLTMDTHKDCQARFALTAPPPAGMYKLTVQVNGNTATDSVTSTYPSGINCPDDCAENYSAGQRVNLKGFPHSSSEFLGWRGDCRASTLPKGFVIMDSDKTCIADFASQ